MEIVESPHDPRLALGKHEPGLVPTMGALHEGHLSLIRRSAAENTRTVVSIFVNPLQFNDPRDLDAYPRTFERDAELAEAAGASLIFAPTPAMLYPAEFATTVTVSGLTDRWEGAVRPGHFAGVTTVVGKLLSIVGPARSYFGEKDFQQLTIIRRMHADLNLPGEIIGCPTVRDIDGLALSSRNSRLSPEERQCAAIVPQSLFDLRDRVISGEYRASLLLEFCRMMLDRDELIGTEYLAIVDPQTLEPIDEVTPGARALLAVKLGAIRLIDNLELLAPLA
ncbi:MAG: pantoate--beta-alanine ligase [Thermomicrobiales bacterium]